MEGRNKFNEIVAAIAEYFDLFKYNSDRLEDLWLQILERLKLPRPTYTVFRKIHYECYKQIVIEDAQLSLIID